MNLMLRDLTPKYDTTADTPQTPKSAKEITFQSTSHTYYNSLLLMAPVNFYQDCSSALTGPCTN